MCSWQQVMVKAPKKRRDLGAALLFISAFFLLVAICCSGQFWEMPPITLKKKKKFLILYFKSHVLCKLNWFCLHQDIKNLHSVGMSGTLGWGIKKPFLYSGVLGYQTAGEKTVLVVLSEEQRPQPDSTCGLEMEKDFLSVCSCWCCDGIFLGQRGEWAHGRTALWPAWLLGTRLKLPWGLRQAEGLGNVQPGDEKALGTP